MFYFILLFIFILFFIYLFFIHFIFIELGFILSYEQGRQTRSLAHISTGKGVVSDAEWSLGVFQLCQFELVCSVSQYSITCGRFI